MLRLYLTLNQMRGRDATWEKGGSHVTNAAPKTIKQTEATIPCAVSVVNASIIIVHR